MKEIDQHKTQIKEIIADNRSGSVKVLNKLLDSLMGLAESQLAYDDLIKTCNKSLSKVCEAHSDLVVLKSFHESFVESTSDFNESFEVIQWMATYKQQWENVHRDVAINLTKEEDLDGKTILTHSSSHTVYESLKYIKEEGGSFNVLQTESRPMFEGRQQASALKELDLEVTLIMDFYIAKAIPGADIVLLGADQYNQRGFLNKIGSYAIAHLAKHFNKPVFVLADSRKEVNFFSEPPEKDPELVWSEAPSEIKVVNQNFEITPMSAITKVITEQDDKQLRIF